MQTSEYEAGKYRVTIDALPCEHFRNALEIGCSVGVLSSLVAPRCDQFLGLDVSEVALRQARERSRAIPQAKFEQMAVPEQFPAGCFDLVLVSEVAYYWSEDDLHRAQNLIVAHLESGGTLLLVHWTPFVPDYPLTGDGVHESFLKRPEFRHVRGERFEKFRLDLLQRQ